MDNISYIQEQLRLFAEQHVPPEVLGQAVVAGLATLVGGIILAVLGARLVRPVVTIAFALVGAGLGVKYAYLLPLPLPLVAIAGAFVLGAIGFLIHKLLVGIVIAAVVAVVALSVFGYREIGPELSQYLDQQQGVMAADGAEFALLTPEQQSAYTAQSPITWAEGFWNHLRSKDADIQGKMAAVGAVAALAGLLLGVLATRFALIVTTSLLGTALVAVGLAIVGSEYAPDLYTRAMEASGLVPSALLGLFLASMVLQGLLNRRPPKPQVLPADE